MGGLNTSTSAGTLKAYFQQFGSLKACSIIRDRFTGQSRGFGFVITEDKNVVEQILGKHHRIDGKLIDCKPALPKNGGKTSIRERKIFVGGLSADVTNEEFRDYFYKFGELEDCIVMRDKESGRPRGFGFITFKDGNSAQKVLLNYHHNKLHGKWIDCKKATPKEKSNRKSAPGSNCTSLTDFSIFDMTEDEDDSYELEFASIDELPAAERIKWDLEQLLSEDLTD